MYALVDSNNFYVSCERIFNPTLRHQPIVVLSNNDGCVISRSNEAKKLGIPMAAAAFEYKSKFKELGIHVFSSNYALYGDMSNRVYRILKNYTPEVEVYLLTSVFCILIIFLHSHLMNAANKYAKRFYKKHFFQPV